MLQNFQELRSVHTRSLGNYSCLPLKRSMLLHVFAGGVQCSSSNPLHASPTAIVRSVVAVLRVGCFPIKLPWPIVRCWLPDALLFCIRHTSLAHCAIDVRCIMSEIFFPTCTKRHVGYFMLARVYHTSRRDVFISRPSSVRAGRRTTTRLAPRAARFPTDDYRPILHKADDGFPSGSTRRIGGMGRGVVSCRKGRRRVLLNRPPPVPGGTAAEQRHPLMCLEKVEPRSLMAWCRVFCCYWYAWYTAECVATTREGRELYPFLETWKNC